MKAFIAEGTGAAQQLSDIQDEKIPIYENESALDADLSNLNVGQIVGTKSGHDDVIDQMKAYIRDQNELSDLEAITMSTNMPYDGFLYINIDYKFVVNEYGNQYDYNIFINGKAFHNFNTTGVTPPCNASFSVPIKKGDNIYNTSYCGTIKTYVRYYNKRDYSNRQ